jgi:N-formylglutamate deformylase
MTSPVTVREATALPIPVVVDSPHSGMEWPADFVPAAPREAILTTWDAFVDELWGDAPDEGATLIAATFPRAYLDVNRAEDDIDPELLATPWPQPLRPTAYTARGMSLIRRNALPNVPMYDAPLSVEAVERRVRDFYRPYRTALAEQCTRLHAAFGAVWHINCHSMKSRGNAMNVDAGAARPDLVVSDRHGSTAAPELTAWVADWFRAQGLQVRINDPYQGGDLVRSFGAPSDGRHSIQLEINRALYMDEAGFAHGPRFGEVRALCRAFIRALGSHVTSSSQT